MPGHEPRDLRLERRSHDVLERASAAGADDPGLDTLGLDGIPVHPYGKADSQQSVDQSAQRLEDLLTQVAAAEPGVPIDVVAHSQGGIVARLGVVGQFVALVALGQLSENFQHANLRIGFGRWGERLWVSPRFHRLHHAVGLGHEFREGDTLGGHNFGVLLPWWDVMFGTARFDLRFEPTGIRDQVEDGVDYGEGFWSQQRLGIKRLMQALGVSSAR